MSSTTSYQSGDWRVTCGICGVLRNRSRCSKRDGILICEKHPGERTRQELNRANISLRKSYGIKSVPDARPQDRVGPDVFQDDEARLFNFLVNQPADYITSTGVVVQQKGISPIDIWDVTNGDGAPRTKKVGRNNVVTAAMSVDAASETIRYLYDLLVDNKRPTEWTTDATRKLTELADFLTGSQLGNINGSTAAIRNVASTAPEYGAFNPTYTAQTTENSGVVAGALYAMVVAYQRLGDTKYIEAARSAATFLRRMQCGDLQTADPALVHNGSFARLLIGANPNHEHYPEDGMLALEALTRLRAVDGDKTYGDVGIVGAFSAGTAATLTVMINECRAFWLSGAWDQVASAQVVGFSSSTPRQYFIAGRSASQARWVIELVGLVSPYHPWALKPKPWAKALRSLYAVEGYSAQVSSVYTFLRSTTANANAQIPTGNASDSPTSRQNCWGTYSPHLALIGRANRTSATVYVTDSAGVATNAAQGPATAAAFNSLNCLYDPQTVGYLARIQSAQEPTRFKTTKTTWARKRPRYTGNDASPTDSFDPLLMDYAGFNDLNITPALDQLDPDAYGFGGKLCRLNYAEVAAINGVIYRLAPFAYPTSEAR